MRENKFNTRDIVECIYPMEYNGLYFATITINVGTTGEVHKVDIYNSVIRVWIKWKNIDYNKLLRKHKENGLPLVLNNIGLKCLKKKSSEPILPDTLFEI